MRESLLIPSGSEEAPPEPVTYTAVAIAKPNESDFKDILELDRAIFPGMEVEEEELRESFESKGVQVILRGSDGEAVGYITSLPHDEAYLFLKAGDPELEPRASAVYVESIGILPENRSLKNVRDMWEAFSDDAKEKGFTKVTGHFRVSQGLSTVAQKRFGGKFLRRLENWSGFGEPFDYIEIDLA
jgi:hypothetical protein